MCRMVTIALIDAGSVVDPNASFLLRPEQIWDLCNDLVTAHGDLLPAELRHLLPTGQL